MKLSLFRLRFILNILFALLTVIPVLADTTEEDGIVVEEVEKGSAAEQAGIQPNDRLVSWTREGAPPANPEAAEGRFANPLDISIIETEQAPRGEVIVTGVRDGKEFAAAIPSGQWKIIARPAMSPSFLQSYLAGKSEGQGGKKAAIWQTELQKLTTEKRWETACWLSLQIANALNGAKSLEHAKLAYKDAVTICSQTEDPHLVSLALEKSALALEDSNDYPEAAKLHEEALKILEMKSPQTLLMAETLNNFANLLRKQGDLKRAETVNRKALSIREENAPESIPLASTYSSLGTILMPLGELTAAEEYFQKALVICQKLVPESLFVAITNNNLGRLAYQRNDLDTAEKYFGEAFRIWNNVAPDSLYVASGNNNLAMILSDRGDLTAAEERYRRALAIWEKVVPDSLYVSIVFNNLGNLFLARGDLASAEDFYFQSLKINEKLSPGSIDVASTYINLSVVSIRRYDWEKAKNLLERALAICSKLTPDGLDVSQVYVNLGSVAFIQGDLRLAEKYWKQSLTIRSRLVPDTNDVAVILNHLGVLSTKQGDNSTAEKYHRRALEILMKVAPNSLPVAETYMSLGQTAHDRDERPVAEEFYKKSLSLLEKLAPGSSDEAGTLSKLGILARESGRLEDAEQYLLRSLEALEAQRGKLGGNEDIRNAFAANFSDYYRDYIDLLVLKGNHKEAFTILERSRAQSLLTMMAERDLIFSLDVPEDLEKERKGINFQYEKTQKELGELSPVKDEQKIESLLNDLRNLREKRGAIAEKIRKAAPRLASLQYPEPLSLAETQQILDPGTLLLAYSVHKERTILFAATRNTFIHKELQVKGNRLRKIVEDFRRMVDRPERISNNELSASIELYELLIQPVEQELQESERVLISPDGILHSLPFSALARKQQSEDGGRSWKYLIEERPIHSIVSATVYAEILKTRRKDEESPATLLALGDPHYARTGSNDSANNAQIPSVVARDYKLEPLPSSRTEVEEVMRIFPGDATPLLGLDATEENVKALSQKARFLHFACHGILDERSPLDSALALTTPENHEGKENGFLQAWEIFESFRTDAELVVLSACSSGLGKELGGEGLIGLSRAFQYAGARSIVASLWSIADETTAPFMKHFYQVLRDGKAKDEALRNAQLSFINRAVSIHDSEGRPMEVDTSSPFFWASFELIGDWR